MFKAFLAVGPLDRILSPPYLQLEPFSQGILFLLLRGYLPSLVVVTHALLEAQQLLQAVEVDASEVLLQRDLSHCESYQLQIEQPQSPAALSPCIFYKTHERLCREISIGHVVVVKLSCPTPPRPTAGIIYGTEHAHRGVIIYI